MSKKEYIKVRTKKYAKIFREHGLSGMIKGLSEFVSRKLSQRSRPKITNKAKDILFISGAPGATKRYRVDFQKERLEKLGFTCDVIFQSEFKPELVTYYDNFIFHRVLYDENLSSALTLIKKQNKLAVYDIDDLVFDEAQYKGRYEFDHADKFEQAKLLEGAKRMLQAMKLFEYGTTTTEGLQTEMKKYIKNVEINRNFPGNTLVQLHEKAFQNKVNTEKAVLGYLSGSYTHNDDFSLIKQVLFKLMKDYPNLELILMGPVDILSEVPPDISNRIKTKSLVEWDKFPEIFSKIDINLVPLIPSKFNECKSEIKYQEASLSKIPTVASKIGAFNFAITDGTDGFLASTKEEWYEKISQLIEDNSLRKMIGENAFNNTLKKYKEFQNGDKLNVFLTANRHKKVTYILASNKISGGNYVSLEHLNSLQSRNFNTSIVTLDDNTDFNWFANQSVPVVPASAVEAKDFKSDFIIATYWTTVEFMQKLNIKNNYYLVQGKENLFFPENSEEYFAARNTYESSDYKYLTVSKWCQSWLKNEFGHESTYIPNAIRAEIFQNENRKFPVAGNPRILIAGNPADKFRNIDEAFEIAGSIENIEVWFVNYGKRASNKYKFDKYFNNVPYGEIPEIYKSCDILLMTSTLDSFSYPPLEMMASGGLCVVAVNDGNKEYVKDGYNALTYETGDISSAVSQIKKLIDDKNLREQLTTGSRQTVKERNWVKSIDILEAIYV